MELLGPQFPRHYAPVRNQLEAAGHKIGDRDTIIASHALLLGATLVTRNSRESSRIAGLQVENREAD